jgi:mitochondrial fission protein ELM1
MSPVERVPTSSLWAGAPGRSSTASDFEAVGVYGRGATSTNGMYGAESDVSAGPAMGPGPLVWALIGPKHGDNAQVRALARALARIAHARVIERPLAYRTTELLVHLWPGPTLAGVLGNRDALAPPWPDLVIGAGRRSEPVARWIRRRSSGRTRIVHLGRPWSAPAAFDLVVTTAQYGVPRDANVVETRLPLTPPDAVGSLDANARVPRPAAADTLPFARLPRPWTGVLVGGDSGFLRFDAAQATALANRLNASLAATGGALLITSAPRTPAAFVTTLDAALHGERFVHRWSPAATNPYRAILAAADVLVVTSDSVSMVADALASGKPVYIYDVQARGHGWWRHPGEYRWRALSHRFVQAFAPARFRRDVRRIYERLVSEGAARWLDGPAVPFVPVRQDPATDVDVAVERVLALVTKALP